MNLLALSSLVRCDTSQKPGGLLIRKPRPERQFMFPISRVSAVIYIFTSSSFDSSAELQICHTSQKEYKWPYSGPCLPLPLVVHIASSCWASRGRRQLYQPRRQSFPSYPEAPERSRMSPSASFTTSSPKIRPHFTPLRFPSSRLTTL